ncbi:MAG: hypothetical protein AAFX02_07220 [Pseudomonadota bacterium]
MKLSPLILVAVSASLLAPVAHACEFHGFAGFGASFQHHQPLMRSDANQQQVEKPAPAADKANERRALPSFAGRTQRAMETARQQTETGIAAPKSDVTLSMDETEDPFLKRPR